MIRFLVDENFNGKIVRGIRRKHPDVDIVRVQDTSVYQMPDPQVLEWAAQQGYILLTHDVETMTAHAHERVARGLTSPGVIIVRNTVPIGRIIDDLLIIIGASEMAEWINTVTFLPL